MCLYIDMCIYKCIEKILDGDQSITSEKGSGSGGRRDFRLKKGTCT